MNLIELESALTAERIDARAYDIFGSHDHPSEAYVIRMRRSGIVGNADYWVTYYSERGLESQLRRFETEDEACRFFLDWVASDGTARMP